jgi:hypothetical protein
MKNTYKDKMAYLNDVLSGELEAAFKRGDKNYTGKYHSHTERVLQREAVEDIRHIRELHVDVRLREAEELADNDDIDLALDKITSAIGYLIILHMRLN